MRTTPTPTPSPEFEIFCLCAEWCGTCRDYRQTFAALAAEFAHCRFTWIDIEERANDLGELDIEDFPTLLIRRGEWVLFFGTLLPHSEHLRRLLSLLCAQSPMESAAYAVSNNEHRLWQHMPELQQVRSV